MEIAKKPVVLLTIKKKIEQYIISFNSISGKSAINETPVPIKILVIAQRRHFIFSHHFRFYYEVLLRYNSANALQKF